MIDPLVEDIWKAPVCAIAQTAKIANNLIFCILDVEKTMEGAIDSCSSMSMTVFVRQWLMFTSVKYSVTSDAFDDV